MTLHFVLQIVPGYSSSRSHRTVGECHSWVRYLSYFFIWFIEYYINLYRHIHYIIMLIVSNICIDHMQIWSFVLKVFITNNIINWVSVHSSFIIILSFSSYIRNFKYFSKFPQIPGSRLKVKRNRRNVERHIIINISKL